MHLTRLLFADLEKVGFWDGEFAGPFVSMIRKRERPQVLYKYSYSQFFSEWKCSHSLKFGKSSISWIGGSLIGLTFFFTTLRYFIGKRHSSRLLIIILRYCEGKYILESMSRGNFPNPPTSNFDNDASDSSANSANHLLNRGQLGFDKSLETLQQSREEFGKSLFPKDKFLRHQSTKII